MSSRYDDRGTPALTRARTEGEHACQVNKMNENELVARTAEALEKAGLQVRLTKQPKGIGDFQADARLSDAARR
jgi:hypothetical protein